jgi:C4-dicarboxylate-specific signal transduction histidine kinase
MDEAWVDDTAFIGKITAGATHEIRNVLSIIKESAGLMGDLLDMNRDSLGPNEEKFRRMIENIGVQVQRGADVAKELNNLAHTPDQRFRAVSISSALKCQSTLYERFCRQKEISLQMETNGQEFHVETDPVRLHRLIGTVMDILLEGASSPGTMTLKSEMIDKSRRMNFSVRNMDGGEQPLNQTGNYSETLAAAVELGESLGFSLDVNPVEGSASLVFE